MGEFKENHPVGTDVNPGDAPSEEAVFDLENNLTEDHAFSCRRQSQIQST
jgi:hypothetical protein